MCGFATMSQEGTTILRVITSPDARRFSEFTVGLSNKVVIQISPHLTRVATLPCELLGTF